MNVAVSGSEPSEGPSVSWVRTKVPLTVVRQTKLLSPTSASATGAAAPLWRIFTEESAVPCHRVENVSVSVPSLSRGPSRVSRKNACDTADVTTVATGAGSPSTTIPCANAAGASSSAAAAIVAHASLASFIRCSSVVLLILPQSSFRAQARKPPPLQGVQPGVARVGADKARGLLHG